MSRSKAKIDLRAFDKLVASLIEEGVDPHVKVGVLSGKGGSDIMQDPDEPGSGSATVAEVAMIHEFGAPEVNIPERSFIRSTFRQKEDELAKMQAQLSQLVVEGKLTMERALELLGAWGAGEVKKYIAEGEHIPPPLKPATVKAKGSSRPLVDNSQLVGSMNFEVAS